RFIDNTKIAVNAVSGMKERRRSSRGCQSRRDFSADQSGFADTRDDHASIRAGNALDCLGELLSDAPLGFGERIGLHLEDTSPTLDDVLASHRLTRAQTSTMRSIKASMSDNGSMFGPSLGAQSGSGWVSIKSP